MRGLGVSVWGSLSGEGGLWLGDPQTKTPWKEHGTRDRDPFPVDRQTHVKILPCPKLCLWAVNKGLCFIRSCC